jgi:uncharacterized protein (DUF1330 family)
MASVDAGGGSMFYALNLFNVEDYATYRQYLTTAGPIVQELGGDLVVMGRKTDEVPVYFPGTTEGGAQRWLIIATYKTEEDVRRFWHHPRNYDNKHLREQGTKDYTWALYEDADIHKVD